MGFLMRQEVSRLDSLMSIGMLAIPRVSLDLCSSKNPWGLDIFLRQPLPDLPQLFLLRGSKNRLLGDRGGGKG